MREQMSVSPPMVLLRPGDRVLVTVAEDMEPVEAQDMAATLRDAFPGVDFTVLAGVASIAVMGE
jgi:protein involved in polysaccharide export with SLBB domain